jgi:hypothetical protein
VRSKLQDLRQNILQTPAILRQIVGHPILKKDQQLEGEEVQNLHGSLNEQINFKGSGINEFSLKYLAKFIYDQRVANLAINGGFMPLDTIKMGNLTLLNLSSQGLHSEDLFILS